MKTKLKNLFGTMNKYKMLIALTAILSVVAVFMNLFTSLRWQGAPGLTFGNVFFTWIPMLIADILIECYGKKKGIAIPAFIYLLQGLFFGLATLLVHLHPNFLIWRTVAGTSIEIFPVIFGDSLRIWFGSVLANYSGFLVNSLTMYYMKKHMPHSDKWYSLMTRAVLSTMLGQFVDNSIFMYVGLNMWDWLSIGLRQLTEVGMEVIFFPITLLLVRWINRMPSGEAETPIATTQQVKTE